MSPEEKVKKLSGDLVKALAELPAYPYDVVSGLVASARQLKDKINKHLEGK